jgi:HSP20 family protein
MFSLSTRVNRDEFLTPFDRLFDEVFTSHYPSLSAELGADFFKRGSFPRVDVAEYDDKLVLEADVAGFKKEDVSVELDGDLLVIKGGGNKTRDIPKSQAKYVYKEIKRSSFQRSFQLGENIDKAKVKAEYKDGTLVVELPRIKVEEKKPDKIKLL